MKDDDGSLLYFGLGITLGALVGSVHTCDEGCGLGTTLGAVDGSRVNNDEGVLLACGLGVGSLDGMEVGLNVGKTERAGPLLGYCDGSTIENSDG